MWKKITNFILDTLFPKFCLNCGKEGSYLCEDCFSLIDIFDRQYCPFCSSAGGTRAVIDGKTCPSCRQTKNLTGLFCAVRYDNPLVKNLIEKFKYEPYAKELYLELSSLIIAHLINLDNSSFKIFDEFKNREYILMSVPIHIKKLKRRGFNQSEEIAKYISEFLEIPLILNALIKTKATPAQVELKKLERQENMKGVFQCLNSEAVFGKKVLLVDDVFTTGTTMEECARILRDAGAEEVWGMVIARG